MKESTKRKKKKKEEERGGTHLKLQWTHVDRPEEEDLPCFLGGPKKKKGKPNRGEKGSMAVDREKKEKLLIECIQAGSCKPKKGENQS